jgi:hypothetical protein
MSHCSTGLFRVKPLPPLLFELKMQSLIGGAALFIERVSAVSGDILLLVLCGGAEGVG